MLIYRKELDGLRTLAVLAVIFYHANLQIAGIQIFKGGFFGVDLFFVLSGYLITGIIRTQMNANKFSLINFYWRRIKRIVPALLVVLVVTSIFAYCIFLPNDLFNYAKSLKSTLYFGSNYYFYGEDSYTAIASIYKPLLHTWSLAVEWQFYIIFPVIVWFFNKFFKQYLFGVLLAFTFLSLQYANYIVPNYPDMAFYLLPTRAWELILGGLITFYNRDNLLRIKSGSLEDFVYKFLPMLGLYLIFYSIIFIGDKALHPSFTTIIPVLGTCLILMFAHKGELINDVLSTKPLVFIGLISYPLYLWHQPVFVFFRFLKHDEFKYEQLLLLLLISIFLAYLTYKFVETKYRRKKIQVSGWLFIILMLTGSLIFSYFSEKTKGFPNRLGSFAKVIDNLNDNILHKINGKSCHGRDFEDSCRLIGGKKKTNLFLLGDSHAGMLGRYIYELSKKENWSYTNISSASCSGIDGLPSGRKDKLGELCNNNIPKIAKYLEDKNNPRFDIIYSIRQDQFFRKENKNALLKIKEKLELWQSLGHKVILVYDVPIFPYSVPLEIKKRLARTLPHDLMSEFKHITIKKKYSEYIDYSKYGAAAFDNIKGDSVIRILPGKIFCKGNQWCIANSSENIYYYDDDHLSTHGAKLIVDEISKSLEKIK